MGFNNVQEAIDCLRNFPIYSYYRKAPSVSTTSNVWHDLSMTPGMPIPNYYASNPLVAKRMGYSLTNGGIYHGSDSPTKEKYLMDLTFMGSATGWNDCPLVLMDYLLYYPFVDEGETEPQIMDNTETISRYTDGVGVQIMAVSVAQRTGGATFQITYTNQDGVSGRVTPVITQNNSLANGGIVTATSSNTITAMLYCPLQAGDTGVRSIQSVQMLTNDSGLFTLVLVKPLANFCIRNILRPYNVDMLFNRAFNPPRIYNDAYLNFARQSNATYTTTSMYAELIFCYR